MIFRVFMGICVCGSGLCTAAESAGSLESQQDQVPRLFAELTAASKPFERSALTEGSNAVVKTIAEYKVSLQAQRTNQNMQAWAGLFLGASLTQRLPLNQQEVPLLILRDQFFEDDLLTINQGCVVLLLQNYYKRGAWDTGLALISSLKGQPITHPRLIDEMNGFCSGAVRNGKAKEACEGYRLFATNLPQVVDGRHVQEDTLVMLANFFALASDHPSRLAVLRSLKDQHTKYFYAHESAIEFFTYLALSDLGEKVEATMCLVNAAKALRSNQSQSIDSALAAEINGHVKTYKTAGWIDPSLEVGIEYNQQDGKQLIVAKETKARAQIRKGALMFVLI